MHNNLQKYIFNLFKQKKFEIIDDYLMNANKEDNYNKEVLITLAIWLDYNEYTWNEYSIEKLEIYLSKFPDDLEIIILYMYFSYKLNLIDKLKHALKWLSDSNIAQYKDIIIRYQLLLVLNNFDKNFSQDFFLYIKGTIASEFISLHYLLLQYYHKIHNWERATKELELVINQSKISLNNYSFPIFEFNKWLDIEIRGNFRGYLEGDGYIFIKNELDNKREYDQDFYLKIR